MYPSIKYSMIMRVVYFFSQIVPTQEMNIISNCQVMVLFGMNNTLITFHGATYLVGGDESPWERGMTIDGYESDWFADLVAAFILEDFKHFFDKTHFYGIYRVGIIAVLKGKKTGKEVG